MQPTAQPGGRGQLQHSWGSEALYTSTRPGPASSRLHTDALYHTLPGGASAPPPLQPSYSDPAFLPNPHAASTSSSPYNAHAWRPPTTPQSHAYASHIRPGASTQQALSPPPAPPLHVPLSQLLVHPYEQRQQSMTSSGTPMHQDPMPSNTTRLSFGPGDPLSSVYSSSGADAPGHTSQSGSSSSSFRGNRTSPTPLASTTHPRMAQQAMSSASSHHKASDSVMSNGMQASSHRPSTHEFDDCPGCRAELDDAIKASLQSAQQEDEERRRQLREQDELNRVYALNAEENERQHRLAQEEEQLLQKAIEDSRQEAERLLRNSTQEEYLLLEESRQYALRQREEDARAEAEMLEAAKLASATHEEQRQQELDAMYDAEKRALQLSLQEQEEEWARRESAERSLLEFFDQRSAFERCATPLSSGVQTPSGSAWHSSAQQAPLLRHTPSSTSTSKSSDLEAEYWRFAGHDAAYQLALKMRHTSIADPVQQTQSGPSNAPIRRPLPQTPQLSGRSNSSADCTGGSALVSDPSPNPSGRAILHLSGESPPAYAEPLSPVHSQSSVDKHEAKTSRRASYLIDGMLSASGNSEGASSARYDSAASVSLDRPDLQQLSSPSSSGPGRWVGDTTSLSSGTQLGAISSLSEPSAIHSSSEVASSASHTPAASPSIPERGSSHTRPSSKRSSTSTSSIASEQRGQRALAGIDFGYCSLPFASKLDKSRLPTVQSSTAKALFPASIELTSVSKIQAPSTSSSHVQESESNSLQSCSFFVIRAHSWKSLLRAIAWYGNCRVEAAPEEVASAGDTQSRCLLRAEVEFVTPMRVNLGIGAGEYAKVAQTTGSMPKNPSPAHVALCLSLLPFASSKSSSAGQASAWLKSDAYQMIKRESRRLDAWYAGKGSTRRLIELARQPPALPIPLVGVAQLLHASHTFSAACPTSSSSARHSPRDLHHAIERHDEGFVQKQKAMLAAGSALASQSGGLTSTALLASPNPRLSMQASRRTSGSSNLNKEGDDDEDIDDGDEELDFNDFSLLEHGMAADGSFDAEDKMLMGKRQRLKAKVKRRLAKRNPDGRAVDEDLATWITPFDLSQHG